MKQARHTDLTVEAAVPVAQVVEHLEQLVAALKSGAVHVHVGAQEIVLGPRGVLGLKLRARRKGKRQKLALELTWRKKLVAPDEGLGLEFRVAPPERKSEAIEVVDLAEASEVASDVAHDGAADVAHDGAASEPAADAVAAAAEKGEAHEGEPVTDSAAKDGTSA